MVETHHGEASDQTGPLRACSTGRPRQWQMIGLLGHWQMTTPKARSSKCPRSRVAGIEASEGSGDEIASRESVTEELLDLYQAHSERVTN